MVCSATRRFVVDVGDGESTWNFRNVFGRKKEEEMAFFLSYTKAKTETLKLEMLSGTEASSTLQTSSQFQQETKMHFADSSINHMCHDE